MLRPVAGFGFALVLLTAAALFAPATGFADTNYSNVVVNSPSLEAYWRLGEAAGSAADSSAGGTNPGTYLGTPQRAQPGAIVDDPNGSVLMDSMDDYVSVPDGPASPLDLHDGPLTIEAWIKRSPPATSSTFETIVSKGGAYGLFLFNNRLVLRQPGASDVATSNIPIMDSTTWHHVVATKNGNAVKLYIDGAERTGTITAPVPTLVDSDAPLQIGVTGSNFFPFSGSIDEVAVYRDVLSPSDVETHQRIGTTPNSARESQLLRYPYLTDVVENYATVNWATDRSAETGVVKWGPPGSCTTNTAEATKIPIIVDGTPEYQWKANLTLSPNAEYCYRVYLGDDPEIDLLGLDQSPQFKTQIPAGSTQPFSFAILGDWGDTRAAPEQANVMRRIAQSGARFVVTTGDNNYANGTQTEYGDLDHAGALTQPPLNPGLGGVFARRNWAQVGAEMPIFPVIGNHDINEDQTHNTPTCPTSKIDPGASTYLTNWPQDRAVTNSNGLYCMRDYPSVNGTNVDDYATPYYAFDAGIARIYILNVNWSAFNRGSAYEYPNDYASNWTAASEQYQWLENDLQQHQETPLKFAFFHYPLYSDDHNEPSDTFLQGANSLSGLLAHNGVQIAFSGHAHSYQRNFADPNGLLSYTTGTGGAIALTVGGPTGNDCSAIDAYAIGWDTYGQSGPANTGDKCGAAPTPVTPAQVYHYLKVTIDGTKVTLAPTDSLGETFDVQSYDFSRGYSRPKGATPVRVPLSLAFKQCTAPNRTHGPPLAFPSCSATALASDWLTVGTPDSNGQVARSSGSVQLRTVVGNPSTPADEADVQVSSSISDVRNKTGLADYTGQVQLRLALRITDKLNGPATSERATGDTTFNITAPCTSTSDPATGSTCTVNTTIDALTPGAVAEGKRSIWELGKIDLYDGGSDGVIATAPNTLFADQGIFIP